MSMIHATALENERASHDNAGAPFVADHKPRMSPLAPCIAGLIVAAAVGRAALAPDMGQEPPAVVADADRAFEASARMPANAVVPEQAVAERAPTAEPDGDGSPVGAAGARTAEGGGTAAGAAAPAESGERPGATTPAGPSIGGRVLEVETRDEPSAVAQTSTGAMQPAGAAPGAPAIDPGSEPPLPGAPSWQPWAIVTGSIERADGPVAVRAAWVVSDVNMRAGPGNGEAVLARIPTGRPVEVIGNSRGWCEVVFAGQRGWIYKRFIGASPVPGVR
jgi:hypothetical protein